MENVLAYRFSKDISQGGGTARQSGWRSDGLGHQKHWLGSGKGQHARGREVPTEAQVGRTPFCTPPVLLVFRALRFEPPSARKSHFPATAGAREQLCEECPR